MSQVREEISWQYNKAMQLLETLGPERESSLQRRQYLIELSKRFQHIVTDALNARYHETEWFNTTPSLRFATEFVKRSELLGTMLQKYGHTYSFEEADATANDAEKKEGDALVAEEKIEEKELTVCKIRNKGSAYKTYMDYRLRGKPKREIKKWLTELYEQGRRPGLVTYNDSLIVEMMKAQSENWEWIAVGYLIDLANMADKFITDLLKHLCPDDIMRDAVLCTLNPELQKVYQNAFQIVHNLLALERQGTLMTLDQEFVDILHTRYVYITHLGSSAALQRPFRDTHRHSIANTHYRRQERQKSFLQSKQISTQYGAAVLYDDLVQVQSMSSKAHIVQEIHDTLQAYYAVALKRFTDNVCRQAGDHLFISGEFLPLRLFSPDFVKSLTEEQLEYIAGEDKRTRDKRELLKGRIINLENANKVINSR